MAGMEGSTTLSTSSANGITGARYRIRIETDEFEPRVSAGDFIEVEERAPVAGDEVFAETAEGGHVLGRFIDLNGGALALTHPCDGRRLEVTIHAGRCWPVVARWHGAPLESPSGHA